MSLLDIIPGGAVLLTAYELASRSKAFQNKEAIVTGTIGKVYYGAQGKAFDALEGAAKTAKTVTAGIRNYALYAGIAIAFVLLWPLIAPLLANTFSSAFKKAVA